MPSIISNRFVFIVLIVGTLFISQFINITNAASYSLNSGSTTEFFTGKTDACSGKASSCDALTQYGIFPCVVYAAQAGDFFGNGFNGGFWCKH
jgi:hypothetical protein